MFSNHLYFLKAVKQLNYATFALLLFITGCQSTHDAAPESKNDVVAIAQSLTALAPTHHKDIEEKQVAEKTASISLVDGSTNPRPKPVTNLWQRISSQLRFDIKPNKRLNERIDWYLKQPHYLTTVSKRAEPYLYHIVESVERRQMPMELVLLPFVESDFRPSVSSTQHAVGAWQLVNATAYHFGITTDHWYDGRKDVLASTEAALDYLSDLHKRFKGNWLHAIAAYNSGEGRVKKAIAKNRRRGKSTDFWHLTLPKETADYVPKLVALSYLLQTGNAHFKRPKLPNYALTTQLDIGQQFDFSVLASLTGIDKSRLHKLNTGYLKHQSSPNGPHKVLLPMTPVKLHQSEFFKRYFSYTYTVKQNDTLYRIARRFNTNVKTIKHLNNKTSDMIRAGEQLRVTQAQKFDRLVVENHLSPYLAQQLKPEPMTMEFHHKVSEGDSLWKISKRYNVSVRDLIVWNKLKANQVLKTDKVLILHLPKAQTTQKKPPSKVYLSDLEQLVKPETRSNR